MRKLEPGATKRISFVVQEQHLATAMGSGDARVFATPMLVAGMEGASVALVMPCLESTETTVGVHVDVFHKAATPIGLEVTFEAKLLAVDGRKLTFRVQAFDPFGLIGEGIHERVLVDRERFEKHAQAKNPESVKKIAPDFR